MTNTLPAARTMSLSGRLVLGAQTAFLVAYLIGSFGVLLSAAAHQHDFGALLDPGLERLDDPKASIPPLGPDSLWNPLTWVFGWARVLAFLVYPLVVAMLLLGAVALLRTRRSDRGVFRRLVVTTAAWLAVGIVAVTPYGGQLMTWLLD